MNFRNWKARRKGPEVRGAIKRFSPYPRPQLCKPAWGPPWSRAVRATRSGSNRGCGTARSIRYLRGALAWWRRRVGLANRRYERQRHDWSALETLTSREHTAQRRSGVAVRPFDRDQDLHQSRNAPDSIE
jgi:hypothetical protein